MAPHPKNPTRRTYNGEIPQNITKTSPRLGNIFDSLAKLHDCLDEQLYSSEPPSPSLIEEKGKLIKMIQTQVANISDLMSASKKTLPENTLGDSAPPAPAMGGEIGGP